MALRGLIDSTTGQEIADADVVFGAGKVNQQAGDPTINDDDTAGYVVGSNWTNTSTGAKFECTDNSTGAADWLPVGGGDVLNNYTATLDPSTVNDNVEGYEVGSRWVNTQSGFTFTCTNATTNTAVWKQTSPAEDVLIDSDTLEFTDAIDLNAKSTNGTITTVFDDAWGAPEEDTPSSGSIAITGGLRGATVTAPTNNVSIGCSASGGNFNVPAGTYYLLVAGIESGDNIDYVEYRTGQTMTLVGSVDGGYKVYKVSSTSAITLNGIKVHFTTVGGTGNFNTRQIFPCKYNPLETTRINAKAPSTYTEKTTLVDADTIIISDSADSNLPKKITGKTLRVLPPTDDSTATIAVAVTDHLIRTSYSSTGTVAVNLPDITTVPDGKVLIIKDKGTAGTNNITITPYSGDTIDESTGETGNNVYKLTSDKECVTLVADVANQNWDFVS